jgi:hypothetical protein
MSEFLIPVKKGYKFCWIHPKLPIYQKVEAVFSYQKNKKKKRLFLCPP